MRIQNLVRLVLLAAVVGLVFTGIFTGSEASGPGPAKDTPSYTKDGELIPPQGYRTWVLAGADLGIEYAADPKPGAETAPGVDQRSGDFHNVYISPTAYQAYLTTGKFPDGTMLVLEVFKAKHREPQGIVNHGFYADVRSGLAVAVKNSKRPDGSKTPWAYYGLTNQDGTVKASAKAFPDRACNQCHVDHASDDNVWVQFYPTLRDIRDARGK